MRNLLLSVVLSLTPVVVFNGAGVGGTVTGEVVLNYSPVMKRLSTIDMVALAVLHRESRGGAVVETEASRREGSVGPMQIQMGMLEHINRICNKRYRSEDRLNLEKSMQMFKDFQSYYNPSGDIDLAAHIWNAGQNRVRERWHLTEQYRADVRSYLRSKFNL